jgi:hypothetical protein
MRFRSAAAKPPLWNLASGSQSGDWRRRTPKRFALILVFTLFAQTASACTVCMGAPGDPMNKGVSNGIWVLLGILGFVQIGFIAMFASFWWKARQLRRFRESLQVIHRFDEGETHP